MNDYDKTINFLDSLGVEYSESYVNGYYGEDYFEICLVAKQHGKVTGYAGFETSFRFHIDKSFAHVAIYE